MRAALTRKLTIFDVGLLVAATAVGLSILREFWISGWFFRSESIISEINLASQCVNEACFPFLVSLTFGFLILRLRRPRPRLRRLARQPGMAACSAASLVLTVPLTAIVIPELFGAMQGMDLKAEFFRVVGMQSGHTAPTPAYGFTLPKVQNPGLKNQPPTIGSVNTPFGPPPAPPAPPAAVLYGPSMMTAPELSGPQQPLWLWYSLRKIHYKIVSRAYVASAIAGAWLTLLLAGSLRPERSWIDRFGTALGLAWMVVTLAHHGVAFFNP